ncbi:cytochrome b/b6 domain-containing protein [Shimia thalassica]|uniref:cytochrome b n=1 Tax=Shimia thalassica TaxID=1715693 RepID=UPI0026E15980|nr:cytochrome b/b6 domain-containing protein [Shimia thalassica]MDO6520538.1 cytochrome b/b6 domain-containing protein [Shimia thalassica]
MNRRSFLKWLHWLSAALILYFFLVEPEDDVQGALAKADALSTHAGMGVLLALVTALWLGLYVRKGLAGRPGPKLPAWGKRFHELSHKVLQIGVPVMVASGAFAGLAGPFAIRAFDWFQITPGIGGKGLHNFAEEVHEIVFNGLLIVIVAHIIFHVGRHFLLKDNALRIMAPRVLHKYL